MAESTHAEAMTDPHLDQVIASTRQWLHECLTSHELCKTATAISEYPRRLIRLEKQDNQKHDLRLVQSNGVAAGYCALSYCWGHETDNFATTTNLNIKDRGEGFSTRDLPQTLQDAVIICRRLEIAYLWVDSLCIMQDNPEDWKVESANMDHIYGGAMITLVATASQHANEGLLLSRWHANGGSWALTQPQGYALNPWFMIIDPWLSVDNRTYSTRLAKISTRAWTLQEEIMSRRTLLWTRHGLIWSCPTKLRREWIEDELVTATGSVPRFQLPDFLNRRYAVFVHRCADRVTARLAWTEALREYLRRHVTRSEDRIVAFAGLTRIAINLSESRIVGGIWLHNLAEDLLWGKIFLSFQTALQREASWSWATLPGDCTADAWLGYEANNFALSACTLLEYQIDPPDGAISGPLRSGQLCIRSKKKRFPSKAKRESSLSVGLGLQYFESHMSLDLDISGDVPNSFWETLECLKMLELSGREFALLISPVDQSGTCDRYRRVGRCEIHPIDSRPLMYGPGLSGVKDLAWLSDEPQSTTNFFGDCSECIVNLI